MEQWLQLAEDFLDTHQFLVWGLFALSLITLVLSALIIPALLARLPADYYQREPEPIFGSFSVSRIAIGVAKNTLGLVLLLAGVGMLVLPGQGILTILAGLALLDFPGKRALELRLLRISTVSRVVHWIRSRRGKPPLEL